jgi:hypothetical protein
MRFAIDSRAAQRILVAGVEGIWSPTFRNVRFPVTTRLRRFGRVLIGRTIESGLRSFELVIVVRSRSVEFFRWFGVRGLSRIRYFRL